MKFKFVIKGEFEPHMVEKVKEAGEMLYDYLDPFMDDDELNIARPLKIKVNRA